MSDGAHPEILIIRRGHGGDHDEHHGGVWKIAFADFMTAMMAFFLVMWLISANDKTRATVARYFNPVKLVDATTSPRGLSDPKKEDTGVTAAAGARKDKTEKADKQKADAAEGGTEASKEEAKPETAAGLEKRLDKALADNPYAALAEIAATKGPGDAPRSATASRAPVLGLRGGEQFRDPFAPPTAPVNADEQDEAVAAITPAEAPPAAAPEPAPADKAAKSQRAQAARLVADTKSELAASLKAASRELGAGPSVDVKRTPEGLLVSLTDTSDFAMFGNGSAVPSRRVVLMMERVAAVMKSKPGTIVVRGYTDNKPFHAARYDNWHLSLDRAQVMHYMLVRGGLPDARISHVEGYADHQTRAGLDPASPLNRRIEILLKDPAPQAAAEAAQ